MTREQAELDDLRRRYQELGAQAEQAVAEMNRPRLRLPAWMVALRIFVALALYAGLIIGVYAVVQAWWGILIGLLLPVVGALLYVVISHFWDTYQQGNRSTLGKLKLSIDGSTRNLRYHWSGSEPMFPAIALVQLHNRIDYYGPSRPRDTLVTRARQLASAHLAGNVSPLGWNITPSEGGMDACELASTRGGITWFTFGSIGGSKPSAEDDVDACLSLLQRGFAYANGQQLARSVLELTESVDESRGRRVKRCKRALAPLVPG